jgi:arsenate reductase
MTEEYTKFFGGDKVFAESAGLEPGILNPYVVQVLREDGIDISEKKTKSVFELYKQNKTYDYVVTVCSREAEQTCPVFPGDVIRLNWPFADPAAFTGSETEIVARVRHVRDDIKEKVQHFLDSVIE